MIRTASIATKRWTRLLAMPAAPRPEIQPSVELNHAYLPAIGGREQAVPG